MVFVFVVVMGREQFLLKPVPKETAAFFCHQRHSSSSIIARFIFISVGIAHVFPPPRVPEHLTPSI